MKDNHEESLLLDHVDMRMVGTGLDEPAADRNTIIQLDPDHPGFRDPEYRARRNRIAEIAMGYKAGAPIPAAPYTTEEHEVWRTIWKALQPAHQKYACADYLNCLQRLAFDTNRIPQLDEVSKKVEAISGFRLEPVAGLPYLVPSSNRGGRRQRWHSSQRPSRSTAAS